jgi:predicted NUDIX family NTP pyrophosphohydrolase
MSGRLSAGLLVYRRRDRAVEVLLVHPGGPFWSKRDDGAWSVPKGEPRAGEDWLAAALREMREETGFAPGGPFRRLAPVRQPGRKLIHAWAAEADWDPSRLTSDTFAMEWPPRSGQVQTFPEVDRAGWFEIGQAKRKILRGQLGLLEQLEQTLRASRRGSNARQRRRHAATGRALR